MQDRYKNRIPKFKFLDWCFNFLNRHLIFVYRVIKISFLFFIFYFLFASSQKVLAASYDPYNVISNSAFTNKNSMTAAQIESFLQSHGSAFANYTIPEYITVPYPYKDANGNPAWGSISVRQINAGCDGSNCYTKQMWGKKVSQLIYEECQEHGINPQLMIVMIQKESSAITQNNIGNATKAWMLGYGYNETMASYGYSKTDAQNRAIAYGGVGQQIARATMWLRLYYNLALQGPIGATCDGVSMNSANAASQVLYLYTPHSQYNVWLLMQQWFNGGNPYNFGPVPNTSLIKYNDNYYLVYNNKRYNLGTSAQAVRNYGYSTSAAEEISSGEFSALISGGNLSNYLKNSSGTEYLIAGGLKYRIWPTDIFRNMWGFNKQQFILPPSELLEAIPNAPRDLTCIVKPHNSSSYYYIDNGGKRHGMWPSDTFWQMWGFSKYDAVVLPSDFVSSLPYARMLTVLVKSPDSSKVYYIDRGGKKYPMWSSAVFWEMWGFRFKDVTTISSGQLSTFPTQKPLTALVRPERGGDLYYIDNGGQKYHIAPGIYLWNSWAFSLADVSVISNAQFDTLPYSGELSVYVRGHLTPWITGKMVNGRCVLADPGTNPVSTLTQGQFDTLRRR